VYGEVSAVSTFSIISRNNISPCESNLRCQLIRSYSVIKSGALACEVGIRMDDIPKGNEEEVAYSLFQKST